MLKRIVNDISKDFIMEAKNSPNLMEDMASMEKYMSESYNGRIFVELLQNADDCGSHKIILFEKNNHLVFANDGRCFDANDVMAISRSGASLKTRGNTIGYRGVGFKSTTYLTDEIVIYSDSTFFTFSKSFCSKALNTSKDKIPTVRIPFLVENIENELSEIVSNLVSQGYTTVFIFKNVETSSFIEELEELENGYFLFLNHVNHCVINMLNNNFVYDVSRHGKKGKKIIRFSGSKAETWIVIEADEVAVALKYENSKAVPCNQEEAVYHCYLPTYDKILFPLKANGNFSTDPSRKHLTNDIITEKALIDISELLFSLIQDTFANQDSEEFSLLLEILMQSNSFSRANTVIKEHLKSLLLSSKWLHLNNHSRISADEYKLLPNWLEESEKMLIRQKSRFVNGMSAEANVYKNTIGVDRFLSQFSGSVFSNADLLSIMKDVEFVSSINTGTYGKLLAHIIKSGKSEQYIHGREYDYGDIAVKTNLGVIRLSEIASSNSAELDSEILDTITQIVGNEEIKWFADKASISIVPHTEKNNIVWEEKTISISKNEKKPSVSKWRSAEQQCVEIETHFGNIAKDVSKQNLGYDIESRTPSGELRYIEVKLLASRNGAFSMTNNEYTAAHQFRNNYYLCLITQSDREAKMLYIRNPLETLSFEKRIRQWEWYCDQYSGVEYSIDVI